MRKFGMGWKPSTPDHRDRKLTISHTEETLPPSIDLSSDINWLYDQGSENSCVAHSISSCIRYVRKLQNLPEIDPSRNFIYWCGRALENDTNRDEGMQIRSGLQAVSDSGYCSEDNWNYMPSTVYATPPQPVYNVAAQNIVTNYLTVDQSHLGVRSSVASKQPVIFGMEVFESMMSTAVAQTGIVPLPAIQDSVEGAHAVLIVGYDDSKNVYKVMNSWGTGWGQKGFFTIPYDFVENNNYCWDFWTIKTFLTRTAGVYFNQDFPAGVWPY